MITHIDTTFGRVTLLLSDADKNGRRSGHISLCDFSDGTPAVNAVESMLLAHALAGVDVQAKAYVEGLNATLEAIDNNDE